MKIGKRKSIQIMSSGMNLSVDYYRMINGTRYWFSRTTWTDGRQGLCVYRTIPGGVEVAHMFRS
jgi:hypothetical protein